MLTSKPRFLSLAWYVPAVYWLPCPNGGAALARLTRLESPVQPLQCQLPAEPLLKRPPTICASRDPSHRQIKPALPVQTYVMSPPHTVSGVWTSKQRSRRLGATAWPFAERVVTLNRRGAFARSPSSRVSRTTRSDRTGSPR